MLIGREREQQAISRLVAQARIGRGGALAILGDAGVGKTALLDWAQGRLEGFRLLRATGTEPERDVPFAGLLAALHPVLDLVDELPPPQAEALSTALALREGAPGDRFAIGAATLSLLCRAAEDRPVALVLDDVHLVDRPSAGALAFAARRLDSDPVAVLAAAREDEADDLVGDLPRIDVPGLDLAAARGLVDSLVPSPVTDDWLARVHQLTGGNPLAIAEHAEDPAALAHTGPDVPPPLSAALATSFARKVRLLEPPVRAVLLAAVVCNGDLRLAREVCASLDVAPEHLATAQHAGLVEVVGGDITFRHPLLRAAIYRDAPPEQRRRVHAAAARALPEDDADRRAWHLSESLWAPDATVAEMLERAAQGAMARSAYAVASTAYERAARLSPAYDDQAARLFKAAESAWSAGLGPRAVTLLDELAQARPSRLLPSEVLELRATIAVRSGSLQEGVSLLEQAAAGSGSPDVRTLLLAEAVHAAFFLADGATTRRLATQLTAALEEAGSVRARSVGMVAAGMAKVLAGTGGVDELRAAVPLLARSVEQHADSRDVPWLMYAPLFIRDADTGRELRAKVDAARERAGVGTLPALLFLLARDEATTDAWPRAAADYTEAIRLARDTGQTTELAMSLAGLSWLESRTGQEDQCLAHSQESLALSRARGIRWAEAWCLFALGDLELVRGDPAAATTHLLALDRLLADVDFGDPDLSPRPELVEALLRLGRADEARRIAGEFAAVADAKGQPWAMARARRCEGLVADDFDAPFVEALALHDQTPDVFECGRTALLHGARLRRVGRRVDAREHLRGALSVFTRLGAEPWADLAAVELDLTGERVPPRALGGVAALTPQELQVALLLADGRTTREAASALFLSPKTVEYHLRKIYTKLGIRSRADLADALSAT